MTGREVMRAVRMNPVILRVFGYLPEAGAWRRMRPAIWGAEAQLNVGLVCPGLWRAR